jgi:hypothetical protein
MPPFPDHEPTDVMQDLCLVMRCNTPESRWSSGGVFLSELSDRYDDIRQEIIDAEHTSRTMHRTALARKIAYQITADLPDASVWRIATDLGFWRKPADQVDELNASLRRMLTKSVEDLTFAFLTTFPMEP